ncbi:MAG: DUF1080 domain-containing protein [Planctomycetales bacterium]|nr:DUF1080 domain-containing protein [Planctomycetales bacterium]
MKASLLKTLLPLEVLLASVVLAALLATTAVADGTDSDASEWIQLFNGKDLDGWTVKIRGHEPGDNFADTFRVTDGVLRVDYDGYDRFDERFGHIFYNHPYSSYDIRVEYRFLGQQCPGGPGWARRNSGIMLHGQTPQSMARDADFPDSIEVQLLGGLGEGPRHTANLCTPGTHVVMDGRLVTRHCTSSTSKTYDGDQWVTVTVQVRGNRSIKHIIDGQTVLEYSQPQLDDGTPLSSGTISLQSERHPV